MRKLRVAAVQLRSGIEPAANRAQALPFIREAAASRRALHRNAGEYLSARPRPRAGARGGGAGEGRCRTRGVGAARSGIRRVAAAGLGGDRGGRRQSVQPLVPVRSRRQSRRALRQDQLFDVTLGGGETYRESETVEGGDAAVLVEGPMGAKIGLSICYDLRFRAALQRAMRARAPRSSPCPLRSPCPRGKPTGRRLLRARAIETMRFRRRARARRAP